MEQSERVELLPALRTSLEAAKLKEHDAGARALAERYAALLDEAAVAKAYTKSIERLERVIERAVDDCATQLEEEQTLAAWDKIKSALAEHSTASDLGPKLLAALTSLGLTPASRAEKGTAAPVTPLTKSPLERQRDAARRRNSNAS